MPGIYRQVFATFWSDPKVVDQFSPEDKYFYLYLLTNEHTNQCGIYQISLKQIAFETGYSLEATKNLIDRFESYLKRIKYNPETHEMAILNWAKYNYPSTVKDNRFACIAAELAEVKDTTLVESVVEHATEELRNALKSLLGKEPAAGTTPPTTLTSPSEAPSKPLGEEKEREQEQEKEKEREPRVREASFPQQIDKQQPSQEVDAQWLAASWYSRFSKATGISTKPDERSLSAARKLLEFLDGDLEIALAGVDYYFLHWREFWFACDRKTRSGPEESRRWEFRFSNFADPQNFQEILSHISKEQAEDRRPWSTGAAFSDDDEPLDTPEERAKAWERIRAFMQQKQLAMATA